MTPLEAAKRLANIPLDAWCGLGSDGYCIACDTPVRDSRHAADCPVLSLPRIVAALKAAEQVVALDLSCEDGMGVPTCLGCGSKGWATVDLEPGPIEHADGCPIAALGAAMQGEENTA
jgi:hypothetical protein